MAIQKDYLTTYGWTAKNAYFKIDDVHVSPQNNGTYDAKVLVYLNIDKRYDAPDKPLKVNYINFTADESSFDSSLSELDNLKTAGYNKLKNLTKSFIEYSTDI